VKGDALHNVIRAGELPASPGGTFEGESYGSGVSFFLVTNESPQLIQEALG
jgi:hypothetical protein